MFSIEAQFDRALREGRPERGEFKLNKILIIIIEMWLSLVERYVREQITAFLSVNFQNAENP